MTRRGRRAGVRFIENDRDRSLTFFKRRAGLYKAVADLSTLTGARVAIVLESESGKFSSFGTPSAGPVVNAFLSRKAPTGPYFNKEQNATITELQNELFQLEKDIVVEDKRKKDSNFLVKELEESSRVAKFAYAKIEDLDADEICEMYHELSRVHREIQHLLPAQHHGEQDEVGVLRDPSLLQPAWWRSLPSQTSAPKVFPWIPVKPSVQLMLPPQQLPSRSSASSMAPLQGAKVPAPQHAIPYNYHIWGMDINSNNSSQYFHSSILPSPPPSHPSSPPPSHPSSPSLSPQHCLLPLSLDSQLPFKAQNYNSIELSQNFASSGSSTPTDNPYYATYNFAELSQNFASFGSSTPTDKPYYASYNSTELSQNFSSSGSSTPTDKPYYASYNSTKLSQKFSSSGSSTPTDKLYYASYNSTELSQKFSNSGSSTPTDKPYYVNYNSTELSQKFSSSGSSTPTDKLYYTNLGGLKIDLGKNSENGGQTDGGHHMLGFSGQLQGDGWIDELLSDSSIGGNTGAGAGNNLAGMNFPWN